jgi:hypothetical protein
MRRIDSQCYMPKTGGRGGLSRIRRRREEVIAVFSGCFRESTIYSA